MATQPSLPTMTDIDDIINRITENLVITSQKNTEINTELDSLGERLQLLINSTFQYQQTILLKLLNCCKKIGVSPEGIDLRDLAIKLTKLNSDIEKINEESEKTKEKTTNIKNFLTMNLNDLTALFDAIEKYKTNCSEDCDYVTNLLPIANAIYTILVKYKDNDEIREELYKQIGIKDEVNINETNTLGIDMFNTFIKGANGNPSMPTEAKKYIIQSYLSKLRENNTISEDEYNQYLANVATMQVTGGRRKKRKSTKRRHKRSHKSPRRRYKRGSKRAVPRRTHRYRFHK